MRRTPKLRMVPVKINGKAFWQVIAPKPEGKGWTRRTFKLKSEAKGHLEQVEVDLLNRGTKGLSFTDRIRADTAAALEILSPFGITLTDAARAYVKAHERELKSEELSVAIAKFLVSKQIDGSRPRYKKDLRVRLNRFAEDFPNRSIASFTAGEIDDWLASLGVAP